MKYNEDIQIKEHHKLIDSNDSCNQYVVSGVGRFHNIIDEYDIRRVGYGTIWGSGEFYCIYSAWLENG